MNADLELAAYAAVKNLAASGLTVATAESCTGGLIAAAITGVPGASAVFRYGWVTYCNEAKERELGVLP
ncbi:MAG: CinA family protein, partial [Akkermansia sp.]|nr:CinA family protein [Akkermansia sp.]